MESFHILPFVDSTTSLTNLGSLSMVNKTNEKHKLGIGIYLSDIFLTHSNLLTTRFGCFSSSINLVDSYELCSSLLRFKHHLLYSFYNLNLFRLRNSSHFPKYHISNIHYFPQLLNPYLISFDSILVANENTLYCIIVQVVSLFLGNIQKCVKYKESNM